MATSSETKHKSMKTKKRKLSTPSKIEKPSKISRIRHAATEENPQSDVEKRENPEKMEFEHEKTDENHQWRNLELVLFIQSKEINAQKKVELIYGFVISRAFKNDDDTEQEFNTLSISRLIMYISNWVQSLLITSEKKFRANDNESGESQYCLDYRCWQILKSCLEESLRLKVSLSLSRDLLRVISCVARSTLNQLDHVHTEIGRSFTLTECQMYNTVNGCLKLLFCSQGRLLIGNLDLWIVTVSSLLELVIRTFALNLQDSDVGNLVIEISCLVLEQFSNFLRVHPCRKNGFHDFVEKLLEPLLHLLGMLPEQLRGDGNLMVQNLFCFVREIISYGLFHLVHLDEYLSLHGTEKYSSLAESKIEHGKTLVKSYLRHLFDKLENLVSKRKVQALSGLGEMLHLFVNCVKKYKDSQNSDASKLIGTQSTKDHSKLGDLTAEKNKTTSPGWNMRKSFFDFFVLITEPLLLDLRKHLQSDFELRTFLMDVNVALKSVNNILSTMVRERIYVRTEDNSEGACLSFFKISYDLLLSCYAKLSKLWNSNCGNDNLEEVEVLHSAAKEFVFVVMNFLEIEYDVIGDDLVSTWLMILTFLAMGHPSETVPGLCPLSSVAVDLGCQVVNLYSELRQVNLALFSLCGGLRHLKFYKVDDEINSSEVTQSDFSLHRDNFAKSGLLLLNSQRFRLAISNAIKSIPEGQSNVYVQTLTTNISETLEWMRVTRSKTNKIQSKDSNFHPESSMKAEILGMVLSEIYHLVLESIPVTTGNSYRTGVELENLIELLRPSMTLLITSEEDGVDTFTFSVFGITSRRKIVKYKNDLQDKAPLLLLFFFRLYVSCRSLYCQTLSLMPPKSTKKLSGMMADLYTAYSGDDLLEMADSDDEGYFSWIVQPSSLLSIMRVLKDSILQEGSACHSCLIYVMHIMILQRLGDLKRLIQCVEYNVQRSENVISSKLLDAADLSVLRKKKRKQDKLLSSLKQEAACLTVFIMEYLSVLNDKQPQYTESGSWDLGVCTVNENNLHIAVWWIICQNIDIWCSYASKKNLKLFLSQLIYNSLANERDEKLEENSQNYTVVELNVTKCKISQDLLCDTNFYDQSFVCRYITSTICNALKKLAPLMFEDSLKNKVEWSSCDWTDDLSVLDNTLNTSDKPSTSRCAYDGPVDDCCRKQTSSQLSLHVAASRSLLNLLCHMMDKALSFKSFSLCLIFLINFERLIVGSFMDHHGTLCLHDHFELLGLFVSCRRAMRYLLMTFCEKSEAQESSSLGIFSESPSPFSWLLKSLNLVVGRLNSMALDNDDGRVNSMVVSLMDQTSYVLVTICKYNFGLAIHWALKPKEAKVSGHCEGNHTIESSKDTKVYESLAMVVEALEVETKSVFLFLEAFNSKNLEAGVPLSYLNRLSSLISCVQGFLWGLECALSDIGTNYKDVKTKLMKHNYKTMSRIINFLDIIVKFIGTSSQIFLFSDQRVKSSGDEDMQNSEDGKDGLRTNASLNLENQNIKLLPENTHSSVVSLLEFGSFSHNSLRMNLLQSFLNGQNLEAAYFLRRLLISSSATMRLNMLFKCSPMSSNVVQTLMGCSEFLLTTFSQMHGMLNSSPVFWLDGTVLFLEALGKQFQLNDATATKDIYTKLVELNIKAIGECIYLQGKGATSVSHDSESVTKLLTQSQVLELTISGPLYGLHDLKTRLRKSFKALIEKPSEPHLSSVMQALQQELTGIRLGSMANCDIQMGITEGGVVSSMVAAGVDCLDLLLENLKGNKLLGVVKRHLNGLIASLFNIVVHLQGPTLFYERLNSVAVNNSPDSGSVVLMCVEVLTRIAGKPSSFHLDSHHVSQSLHVPGTLFQCFRSLKAGNASHRSSLGSNDSKEYAQFGGCFLVDRQFSINLYAASCRLLSTIVKHHKSDCVRCKFLLQTSLQALLYCLEHVCNDTIDRKGYFTWEIEEAVKCASYLRRVYEEIRQQKDVFGPHSYKFLSDYIWVYSGYGSFKHGLKREVDEALRPGVYALIDVCSPDDLQHLHTVFGEGPRRSTLASLKHDYEHNFKYGGKV